MTSQEFLDAEGNPIYLAIEPIQAFKGVNLITAMPNSQGSLTEVNISLAQQEQPQATPTFRNIEVQDGETTRILSMHLLESAYQPNDVSLILYPKSPNPVFLTESLTEKLENYLSVRGLIINETGQITNRQGQMVFLNIRTVLTDISGFTNSIMIDTITPAINGSNTPRLVKEILQDDSIEPPFPHWKVNFTKSGNSVTTHISIPLGDGESRKLKIGHQQFYYKSIYDETDYYFQRQANTAEMEDDEVEEDGYLYDDTEDDEYLESIGSALVLIDGDKKEHVPIKLDLESALINTLGSLGIELKANKKGTYNAISVSTGRKVKLHIIPNIPRYNPNEIDSVSVLIQSRIPETDKPVVLHYLVLAEEANDINKDPKFAVLTGEVN